MIKIPAFVIGGLLILTGIAGYVLQDPGLSLKITGPLAEDAKLVLSDGKQKHELDLGFASSDAAGEHAYWLIYNLNAYHAKDSSQGNYAVDQTGADYEKKSFWYASSKGETMDALSRESDNYQGAGNDEEIEVDWSKVDINSSTIRFVFKNQIDSPGPITLQSNNWKNIDISSAPKDNEKVEFKKSWTAFIPGILGLIIVLLTLGAVKFPNAHKHFMHVAVLIGLIGFIAVAGKVGSAVSEMNLLKSEPFMIIHVSSLKPVTMLLSAGLLLIFVILCVVSFIEARKNRVAEEKRKPKTTSSNKESSDKKDLSKDSEKKEVKEKDSEKKEGAEGSKNEDAPSKSSGAPKPQAKKEPANTEKDTSKPKKEETPTSDKKPSEAPKASTDIEEKKSDEAIKEAPSSKGSSSSDSNSKDKDDSNDEKDAAPKSEAEEKKEEKPKPNDDSEKSDKEDKK
jgi:hypothetical protein